MGKYVRKGKLAGKVVVKDVPGQFPAGVRTRTRSLALQRIQKPSSFPATDKSSFSSSSYLQFRSCRPEKPCITLELKELAESSLYAGVKSSPETNDGVEPSLGENALELDARDRDDRESTPCSLITKPESIKAHGFTTKLTTKTPLMHQRTPCAHEIEEFFSHTERVEQQKFIKKYNYDPVSDSPVPGRYEWTKLGLN